MEITVGHPLNQRFLKYYMSARGEMGSTEEGIVKESPEHLIVWEDDDEILGHAIWHSSDTESHPDGSRREEDDREVLLELLGGPAAFVELHEIWLLEEHRGKGYGEAFLDLFEDMMTEKGFRHIVYYADHPAALAICRRRGYREAHGVELDGGTFYVLTLDLGNNSEKKRK
jgi:GNAT superfamily N-acetyltransferase